MNVCTNGTSFFQQRSPEDHGIPHTLVWFFEPTLKLQRQMTRAVHSGGARGQLPPPGKLNVFFSNIVSDFAGLFLVAILVRNLTKTEFAPADKKS